MIKGLIICHGNLGREFISVVREIVGRDFDMDCIQVNWQENGSRVIRAIEGYMEQNKDRKLIILTDMFGGSPSNIALRYSNNPNVEILSGINLPALLKYYSYHRKETSVAKLASLVKKRPSTVLRYSARY